jgi:hypothetical protein
MPWQRYVADVGLEMLEGTSVPAYREIVVTIPRQNGKTTLTLAFEIQRALGWGGPQSIAYTAQTGKDAREKLLNDQAPLLVAKTSSCRKGVSRVLRGVGNEAITFVTGSRIFILNSGEDSGHGKTIDLGVIDESFADEDDRREQSMLPAMLTRPAAQILNISTAGTERSVFLKRKVDAGRAAVANGETQGIAYFEWSADEEADPDDPATWRSCMPALGWTISEDVVRHLRQTMTEGEFRRSALNQWTISEERVIPASLWNGVCADDVAPEGRMVIGLDVNPERSAAAIAIADEKGRVELVDHRQGIGWVIDRVVELSKKFEIPVALDSYGPAGSLVAELESQFVKVHSHTAREMAHACGVFYDAVADSKIQIRRHAALDTAAAAARKRQMSDVWIWGRRDALQDVSPLIAATLAYEKAVSRSNESEVWVAWE